MKNLLVATAMAVAMIEAAHAATYTYMCRDHHKLYPVTLDTGKDDSCDGATTFAPSCGEVRSFKT